MNTMIRKLLDVGCGAAAPLTANKSKTEDYRAQAAECQDIADRSSGLVKGQYAELAHQWASLAERLERQIRGCAHTEGPMRGRRDPERPLMRLHKALTPALVVALVAACSVAPAAAAPKERSFGPDIMSLDGRTTGRPRTCGYDYFVYGTSGSPVGPYCH